MTEYKVTNKHFPKMFSVWIVHWEMLEVEELKELVPYKDTESLATLVERVILLYANKTINCHYDEDYASLNDELPMGIVLDGVNQVIDENISWIIQQV